MRELLARVGSAHELTELLCELAIEPRGAVRQDLGHAITSSTIANVNRGKGRPPFSPSDFLPDFEPKPPPREQTPEEQWEAFVRIADAHNERLREH